MFRFVAIGLSIVVFASVAGPASAANTTCTNADFVFMGVGRTQTVASGASVFYKVRVVAGRSYSVSTWAPAHDAGQGTANLNHEFYANSTCTIAAMTVSNDDTEPRLVLDAHNGDNDSIIPNFTGTMYIRVTNGGATAVAATTTFQESTIFSPWFFVGGAYNAFIELKNTTESTIAVQIRALSPSGAVCGTAGGALVANANVAWNVREFASCVTAGSGSVEVAFYGLPGAVVGNVTTLDGVLGLSFDAPFTARMPWGPGSVFDPSVVIVAR